MRDDKIGPKQKIQTQIRPRDDKNVCTLNVKKYHLLPNRGEMKGREKKHTGFLGSSKEWPKNGLEITKRKTKWYFCLSGLKTKPGSGEGGVRGRFDRITYFFTY